MQSIKIIFCYSIILFSVSCVPTINESIEDDAASNASSSFANEIDDGLSFEDIPPSTSGNEVTQSTILASSDDAEEQFDGRVVLNSSDIELGEDKDTQTVGLRFTNLTVPQNATITRAYIQFKIDEADSVSSQIVFRGESSDHASSFSSALHNVTNRPLTSALKMWMPGAWSSIGSIVNSVDLSTIVQEIVSHPGWYSGNAMAFVIKAVGTRTAESFDGDETGGAKLIVEFDANSTPTPLPPSPITAPPITTPAVLKAFPTAVGPGAETAGGRGGRVIEVTNLKESGAGSLREALEADGPRIVVFKVAGIIDLDGNRIYVKNPYLTVAGQTAPSGGITVKGQDIQIRTHDVIMRFIKVRAGTDYDMGDHSGDGIGMSSFGDLYNNIIDHCTMTWANDENAQIWSKSETVAPHHITYSWNIFAEGISGHSCGFLAGASNDSANHMKDISLHHNLFASNHHRNPMLKIREVKFINNLVYNWDYFATAVTGGVRLDLIGNKYKPGPETTAYRFQELIVKSQAEIADGSTGVDGEAEIFIRGNVGPRQLDASADNWAMVSTYTTRDPLDRKMYERTTPLPKAKFPIIIDTIAKAEQQILLEGGASKRINERGEWVANRDTVDQRIINDYKNGTGHIPSSENDVGGYPTASVGKAYADSDHDGMADVWEDMYGFKKYDKSDNSKDQDGDGYTNVEEFINGTNPILVPDPKPVPPMPAPTPILPAPSPPTPTPILPTPVPTPVIAIVSQSTVLTSADDAEERSDGSMYLDSSDIELGVDKDAQTVGLRFVDMNIPKGSNITKAYIKFKIDEADSGTSNIIFRGEDSDSAAIFTSATSNISNRPKTSASVSWSPTDWSSIGSTVNSVDISPLIQEIISRSGWQTGNSIVVTATGTGTRTAESFDGDETGGAVLVVEFDSNSPPTTTPSPAPIIIPPTTTALKAFPTAQGYGSETIGGRGGKVFEVTNLNDSGTGSLREAVEATVPRTIVFKVAGYITLKSNIYVKSPFITIAGQTAPGGGITIRGGELIVNTHDVIIRFLKIRSGKRTIPKEPEGDSLSMLGRPEHPIYNNIIDHCSLSWAVDENVQIWSTAYAADKAPHDIAYSWNIISEALQDHSMGFIIGSYENTKDFRDIAIHHNVLAHNYARNPLVKVYSTKLINNIIYNWGAYATGMKGGVRLDAIGNIYKAGKNTSDRTQEITIAQDGLGDITYPRSGPPGYASVYLKGNIGPHQPNEDADNWLMAFHIYTDEDGHVTGKPQMDKDTYQRLEPLKPHKFPIKISRIAEMETMVLNDAGASRRINEQGQWVSSRDIVDTRVLNDYKNTTGIVISHESEVGGYPAIAPGIAYLDSDHDGMADVWEDMNGLNKNDYNDNSLDKDGDGYTNLEEFINGTSI